MAGVDVEFAESQAPPNFEQQNFLLQQRRGRRDTLAGVDVEYAESQAYLILSSRIFCCTREEEDEIHWLESMSNMQSLKLMFWEEAELRTKHKKHCKTKLHKLYKHWRSLQKGAKRKIPSQLSKEETFKTLLEDIFDIAAQNAQEEVKNFLLQRRPERGQKKDSFTAKQGGNLQNPSGGHFQHCGPKRTRGGQEFPAAATTRYIGSTREEEDEIHWLESMSNMQSLKLMVWEEAELRTKNKKHCKTKLHKLYKHWRSLQKGAKRKIPSQLSKEETFKTLLEDIFDIVAQNAQEEVKNFLLQRRPERGQKKDSFTAKQGGNLQNPSGGHFQHCGPKRTRGGQEFPAAATTRYIGSTDDQLILSSRIFCCSRGEEDEIHWLESMSNMQSLKLMFWEEAKLRAKHKKHCKTKLHKLYKHWRSLQKGAKRKIPSQLSKEETFKTLLEDIFDIAAQNAQEEVKNFLLQRRPANFEQQNFLLQLILSSRIFCCSRGEEDEIHWLESMSNMQSLKLMFWEESELRTKHKKHCKTKLHKLYKHWRSFQKGSKRRIPSQLSKEENFKTLLEDIFDIALQKKQKRRSRNSCCSRGEDDQVQWLKSTWNLQNHKLHVNYKEKENDQVQWLESTSNLQNHKLHLILSSRIFCCRRGEDNEIHWLESMSNMQSLKLHVNYKEKEDDQVQWLESTWNLQNHKLHVNYKEKEDDQVQWLESTWNLQNHKLHVNYKEKEDDQVQWLESTWNLQNHELHLILSSRIFCCSREEEDEIHWLESMSNMQSLKLMFWEEAELRTKHNEHCKTKLHKLYNEWRSLQKGSKRRIPSQISKEENFKTLLEDIFDIALVIAHK
ncbi:hypothetical protein GE061_002468 [Apolygus lucorum]|uniref:Uncharacterized protein n=1 Tax=Apolygus lucorum TaxID=248454 RepID=A0A8S9X6Y7_APOLU|nr:hypothetical protein GE061_002468 [Apolygus lucorum]